jgi:hypothetical protein
MYQVQGEILQQVVDYLATKPYAEVHQLINALQHSTPVEDQTDDN